MRTMEGLFTQEYLQREIELAENALKDNERRAIVGGEVENAITTEHENLVDRLRRLECQAEDLILSKDLVDYYAEDTSGDDVRRLSILCDILCRHGPRKSGLYAQIYHDEFRPLYNFAYPQLIQTLRRQLTQAKYPSLAACADLLRQFEENNTGGHFYLIQNTMRLLAQLTALCNRVKIHVEGSPPVDRIDPVLLELCRPFVDRIKFHFVEDVKTSKIDRLPELLLGYVRDNIFAENGTWELIYYGLAPELALDFMNEIIRLIQWVFGERNFFRHPIIAGPESKPLLLCNAVEHLLQLDRFVRDLVPVEDSKRIISLVDVCIAGDEELLEWWLARERESVYSLLFEDPIMLPKVAKHRVLPRAELFCALIRSVRAKASVFSFSGPYLNQVAAPLCSQFIDALHETAAEQRKVLTQRKLPTEKVMEENVLAWIEIINGVHMAATLLLSMDGDVAIQNASADHDLAKFGRSLNRICNIMVEEFVSDTVEIAFLERAKLAGYLMRCSYILSTEGGGASQKDLSADLIEACSLLRSIVQTCNDSDENEKNQDIKYKYAPSLIKNGVLSSIAEKLLEVALDMHGMTPDLFRLGCLSFKRDVNILFGESLLPQQALRVVDLAKFMSLEGRALGDIGGALCALAGKTPPLCDATFEVDDRLFEEAISMIRAKGFIYLELSDVLSILNRRRD